MCITGNYYYSVRSVAPICSNLIIYVIKKYYNDFIIEPVYDNNNIIKSGDGLYYYDICI